MYNVGDLVRLCNYTVPGGRYRLLASAGGHFTITDLGVVLALDPAGKLAEIITSSGARGWITYHVLEVVEE